MMARKVDDGTSVVEVEVKMTAKVVDRHLLIKPQKWSTEDALEKLHNAGAPKGVAED